MNEEEFDPKRSEILRAAIIAHVHESATNGDDRASARWRPGALALGVVLLAGGGGLTAASALGLISWPLAVTDPLPGGETREVLLGVEPVVGSRAVDFVGEGTRRIDLPRAPENATHASAQLTCLSPGGFSWGPAPRNNPSMACDVDDVGTRAATTWYDFPLDQADALHVGAESGAQWRVVVVYVSKARTDWGVNARGETFGVMNDAGSPDLIAVIASNGLEGYVYTDALAEADGTQAALGFDSPEDALAWQEERRGRTFRIPVYLSDGETLIGEFVIEG